MRTLIYPAIIINACAIGVDVNTEIEHDYAERPHVHGYRQNPQTLRYESLFGNLNSDLNELLPETSNENAS